LIIFVIIITIHSLAVLEIYSASMCSMKYVSSMYKPVNWKTQKVPHH